MVIYRRIFGNIDSDAKKILIEGALKVKLDWGFFNYDVDEQAEKYDSIKRLVASLNLQDDVIGTTFTKGEVEQSDAVVWSGKATKGYPQPEDPIEVNRSTYRNSCHECGVHDEQYALFKIKNIAIRKNKIFALNWIHDEVFVERAFYDAFFSKLGIDMVEVLNYRNGKTLDNVVQLKIPKSEVEIDMRDREFVVCAICGRKKYSPTTKGFFPMPSYSGFDIIKTKEYFGSGGSAFNQILIFKDLMKSLMSTKLAKYYNFIPARLRNTGIN